MEGWRITVRNLSWTYPVRRAAALGEVGCRRDEGVVGREGAGQHLSRGPGRAACNDRGVVHRDPGGLPNHLLHGGPVGRDEVRPGRRGHGDEGHLRRVFGRQRIHEAAVLAAVATGKAAADPDEAGEGGHAQRLQGGQGLRDLVVLHRIVPEAGVQRVAGGQARGLSDSAEGLAQRRRLCLAVQARQVVIQQNAQLVALGQEVLELLRVSGGELWSRIKGSLPATPFDGPPDGAKVHGIRLGHQVDLEVDVGRRRHVHGLAWAEAGSPAGTASGGGVETRPGRSAVTARAGRASKVARRALKRPTLQQPTSEGA